MLLKIFRPGLNRQILIGFGVVILGIFLTPFLIGVPIFILGWLIILWGFFAGLLNRWRQAVRWLDFLGFSQLPEEVQNKIRAYLLVIVVAISLAAFFLLR